MSHKIDRREIDEAREDVRRSLWQHLGMSQERAEDLFAVLLAWVGLEVAAAIQERDERGPWP